MLELKNKRTSKENIRRLTALINASLYPFVIVAASYCFFHTIYLNRMYLNGFQKDGHYYALNTKGRGDERYVEVSKKQYYLGLAHETIFFMFIPFFILLAVMTNILAGQQLTQDDWRALLSGNFR